MSKAYLIDFYKVNKAQLDLINDLDLSKDSRTFLCHTLVSNLIKWGEKAPIGCELIQAKIPQAKWKSLVDRGLIEATDYSYTEHKSREFTVNLELIDLFLEAGKLPLAEDIEATKYNLFTGKVVNTKQVSSFKLPNDTHQAPQLVKDAINSIPYCLIRLESLEVYIKKQEALYIQAKEDYFTNSTITKDQFNTIRGQYYSSETAYNLVVAQKPIKIEDDLYSYVPAYQVQMSGRICQVFGAMTNACREMKEIAYKDIKDLHNYDLQASQVNGLIQQFEAAEIDTTWLEAYKANPNSKYEYATLVGVSVDCWKQLLIGTIMGSSLPTDLKKAQAKLDKEGGPLAAVLATLNKEFLGDIDKVISALKAYAEAIKPLKESLDKWHNYLVTTHILLNSFKVGAKGHRYITNPTGMRINVTELLGNNTNKDIWKAKATLAHFILAGQESAFIHHLSVLGKVKEEFVTLGSEYDGLITLHKVLEPTIKQAGLTSGLKNPILVEKPFN
jgi:hypothetical protein